MRKLFFVYFVAASLMFAGSTPAAVNPAAAAATAARVNINTASAAELERLPGIGQATAVQIVKFRNEKGRFTSTGDLVKVKGVGPKTLEKIINQVTVE